jgi:signal transduction histidine kinase
MKYIPTALILLVFLVRPAAFAAEVDYQPPNLSIVATNEPLGSVLRSISAAMDITVSMPPDLDSPVTCDIENMPVERAFKKLLAGVSYALRWEQGGGRMTGIVLLEEGYDASLRVSGSSASGGSLQAESGRQYSEQRGIVSYGEDAPQNQAAGVAEEQDRMAAEMAEHEVKMALEMEQHEIRMAQEMERERERMAREIEEERIRDENEVFIDYDD